MRRNEDNTSSWVGWLWYLGQNFLGFQEQPRGPTVQLTLKEAFELLGFPNVVVMPSGRTDKGVHARMQVLSLRVPGSPHPSELMERLNQHLASQNIGFVYLARTETPFHAQWHCQAREYRYRFSYGTPQPLWKEFVWQPELEPRLLDRKLPPPEVVHDVLQATTGTHNFSAFHEKSSVLKPRRIEFASLIEIGHGLFEVCFRADSFGRHQVRYMVGTAIATAMGLFSVQQWHDAIHFEKALAGIKAPAAGLVLWEVFYPQDKDPFSPQMRYRAQGIPLRPPFHNKLLA